MRTITAPGQSPQGHSIVPITGGFQEAIGQNAGKSHLGSLSHLDRLDPIIF